MYHCWLTHKLATIPTEAEALGRVLSAHTASQVPKSKAKRKQNLPTGGARYDSISPEWVSVLEEQENRKKKKKTAVKKSQPAKVKTTKGQTKQTTQNMSSKSAKRKIRV